jgi:hypothetical protein
MANNFYTDIILNGDGTLTDSRTGLVWLNDAGLVGKYSYEKAKNEIVKQISDGKYNLTDGSSPGEWRLPTFGELETILRTNTRFIQNVKLFYWTEGGEYAAFSHFEQSLHYGENNVLPVRLAKNNGISTPFAIWRKLIRYLFQIEYQAIWYSRDVCLDLNADDIALAQKWAKDEINNDYTTARMLSARAAEKVAIKFYQSLEFKVSDVSIKQHVKWPNNQPNNNSQDWKLCDLLLNDEISIDVKNARTSLNSKVTYVEHCVSKFKNNRNNQNVIIAGILSTYLKLDDIQSPDSIGDKSTIIYLGETSILSFSKLEERFSPERLGKRLLKLSLNAMNFVPRWMFEYPDKFYESRNQCRLQFQEVSKEYMPSMQQCQQIGVNPIPAYLSNGINLPDAWKTVLSDWQIDFYSRIRPHSNTVITMPVLFLALLTHFLEALTKKEPWKEYNPLQYRQLLYADLSKSHDPQLPLGIYDPLGTIVGFIETLSTLWYYKDHTNLKDFELFKFNGVGLLEGKKLNQQKYETILAYCGGFIEGKGRCGNNPLIIGKHDVCKLCGKLICDICGHCNTKCSECSSHMIKCVPRNPGVGST